MQSNRIIQVEEKVLPRLLVPLSIQHMFAMFGASVLVPFIFKMNPAIVLFMNGARVSRLVVRIYRTGDHRYQQLGLSVCTRRLCCRRCVRLCARVHYL